LSATGADEVKLKEEVARYANQIIDHIKPYVAAEEDVALEKAILDLMKANHLTLSTAESCTGGYISHLLTQHAGSSAVFVGGAVAYSYDLKESILSVKHQNINRFWCGK
jgi:nicotinamide-nucleotide amidase